jgi:hypothetical protein
MNQKLTKQKSMKIKDYLYLYKDCLVRVKRKMDQQYHIGRVCEITSGSNHGDWIEVEFPNCVTVASNTLNESTSNMHHFFFEEDSIEPFFRPVPGMTPCGAKGVICVGLPARISANRQRTHIWNNTDGQGCAQVGIIIRP